MPLGTDIVYPATLPTPQAASIQSVERRVLSSEGYFESRAGQTDRLSIEEIAFPPLTPAEALIFDDWWRDDLLEGGIWFAAAWPRPEGQTSVARRFLRPPSWDYIGAPDSGYWRVTATFEVRGTGELPETSTPSAWNPLDIMTAQDLPHCLGLTENNRLATRNTVLPDSWEVGVRGAQSRGGTAGEKWYLELEVVSIGDGAPSANQGMQFGLVDGGQTNILSRPPPSDSSEATGSGQATDYFLAYTRTDGVVFASEPSPPTQVHTFGTQAAIGDIYSFSWHVGTSITVRRNNAGADVSSFTSTGPLFPYFSAGLTLVDATNLGSTESCRIRTGSRQFAYEPPDGYFPWG
jgi:hypothetical protein